MALFALSLARDLLAAGMGQDTGSARAHSADRILKILRHSASLAASDEGSFLLPLLLLVLDGLAVAIMDHCCTRVSETHSQVRDNQVEACVIDLCYALHFWQI